MSLNELTKEQRLVLKMQHLIDTRETVYYSDLADADELVSDQELEQAYGGTDFAFEDFFPA